MTQNLQDQQSTPTSLPNSLADQYELMHTDPTIFLGHSMRPHLPQLYMLMYDSNIKSVLDFGCGKANLYDKFHLKTVWGVNEIYLYDPGIPERNTPPKKKYDLTLCIDVMEHIPEEDIDSTLKFLVEHTNRAMFFSISTRPAGKKLPNGKNAHVTIKDKNWWREKLKVIPQYYYASIT